MATRRRMWDNGPLRVWSEFPRNGSQMQHGKGGFVGAYICDGCGQPVAGLYRDTASLGRWVCGGEAEECNRPPMESEAPKVGIGHSTQNPQRCPGAAGIRQETAVYGGQLNG